MADEKPEGLENKDPDQMPNQTQNQEPPTGAGESTPSGGAEQPDYGMILDMIKDVQSNQAVIMGKLKSLSDAQSILVDSGAVVHEDTDHNSGVQTSFSNDGFISLDKMDLSI